MSWRLKRTEHLIVLAVSVAVAFVTTARADIINVPDDFLTIQEAIDAAMDGDEVEVHPGTYFETINFLGKAIRVYSSDGPDVTIIDGRNAGSVVSCISGEDPDSVLEGFTITGGLAQHGGGMRNDFLSHPTITNCIFTGNTALTNGGGMYNRSSSPTVTDCIFAENTASSFGGGMFNKYGSPVLANSTFSQNTASTGGGMYNGNAGTKVFNCTFFGNTATNPFEGGGGIFNQGSNPTIMNCTFTRNEGSKGGAVRNRASSPRVIDCIFSDNTAATAGGAVHNQGIGSNPRFISCVFYGNVASGVGGGIFSTVGDPTVLNCTFSENLADEGGGMYNQNGSSPTVTNSVFWNNSGEQIVDVENSASTVRYSDVQGGWVGDGGNNINADPLFVDPDNGDYRLMPGSPCIDAGNNWGVPIDALDYDEDDVLCELFPVDLDGNPRFNADEADFDPGCGVPVVVDMGAYEYQFDQVDQVTFADLNGDNVVGATDLLGLLVSWGPCGKGCCLADLNIDGSVGASDLLALLVNWGPCP